MFELHPQLAKDGISVGDFPLSRLLLINDSHYPWFVLVPRRAGISEVFELTEEDQLQLGRESVHLSRILHRIFNADKLNVAALGNMVSQLHVHHIIRYRDDIAWPAPVWGKVPASPYSNEGLAKVLKTVHVALEEGIEFVGVSS
ncbi:MAG: HIT domain-containing protein [Halopseudomonas sp.]|uniref:HIT domain-containing protein n=1 Tax=Halopseudomonas sp. TaxID=2901191 RepID=UPI003001F887